jgi:hypothetical protein
MKQLRLRQGGVAGESTVGMACSVLSILYLRGVEWKRRKIFVWSCSVSTLFFNFFFREKDL